MGKLDVYAPSDWWTNWDSIDWSRVHAKVKRLQVRIAEAAREGVKKKVRALQRLLATSRAARLLAVRRVTTNKGKRTPGVDGVIWNTRRKKVDAVNSLKRRGYRPMPLRRVYVPKKNGKRRPLGIPIMIDRAMQAIHKLALEPIAESQADKNSYGFRPRRSVADALGQCYILLAKGNAPEWVFEADIEGCFDNFDHQWMLANIPMDKAILKKWLKAGYLEKDTLYPTEKGTPQGGLISPVLANMTLDGLEIMVRSIIPQRFKRKGINYRSMIHIVRYADDFIITCYSKEVLEQKVIPAVESFLRERGLRLSPTKSRVTNVRDGFNFLGAHIRKYPVRKGKLLIKPASSNVLGFVKDIKEFIYRHRQAKTANLIHQLNRKIRGWANHYRHLVSGKVFSQVDSEVYKTLWKWARRRHPRKRAEWVKDHYFKTRGRDSWIFFAKTRTPEGGTKYTELVRASGLGIRRHVKVRAEARVFDPAYDEYFEDRRRRRRRDRQRDHFKRLRRAAGELE